jgi:hypothetical protein
MTCAAPATLLLAQLGGLTVDWMLSPQQFTARGDVSAGEIVLTNGLVRRVIRMQPGAGTVALDNLLTGETMLRAVLPEATLTLNGRAYAVGGLDG